MRRDTSKYPWGRELPSQRRRETYNVRWHQHMREQRVSKGLTTRGEPRKYKCYTRHPDLAKLPPLERRRERDRRRRKRNVGAGLTTIGTPLKIRRHGWKGLTKAEWEQRFRDWSKSQPTRFEQNYRAFREKLDVRVRTFDDIPVGKYDL